MFLGAFPAGRRFFTMAKQPIIQDDLKEMTFPSGGVNLVQPSFIVHADTSEQAENVRFFEVLDHRARGGSRSGITKFLPEQVSGNHEIQHITAIVTVDGEMIDWSFDGPNQEFPGIYGGIGFIDFDLQLVPPFLFPPDTSLDDGIPGSEPFTNASGYPPKAAEKKTILEITVDQAELPFNESTLLTMTLLDGDRNPFSLPNKRVTLYTDPPDQAGDGFATTIVGGSTQTSVGATEPMLVLYQAFAVSVRGNVVAKSNRLTVRYLKATPVITWATPSGISTGTPLSGTQLNATAGVAGIGPTAGVFTYTPPSGTVLPIGDGQILSVHFDPTDRTKFNVPNDKTVTINVSGSDVDPDDYLSTVLTGPGAAVTGNNSPMDVVLTSGTISVIANPDPGTVALPDTTVGWPFVSDDTAVNVPGAFSYPYLAASARQVGGAWYYHIPPF